ncbi:MAG: hypothetical protein IJE29_00150 [Firmicutes bacterium]|nr:hypothetical protein [Bacillota bacterium]
MGVQVPSSAPQKEMSFWASLFFLQKNRKLIYKNYCRPIKGYAAVKAKYISVYPADKLNFDNKGG